MRLEARAEVSRTLQVAAPFAAIAFTLVVCSLLVAWAGVPVGSAYLLLLEGGFGSGFAVSETLTRATVEIDDVLLAEGVVEREHRLPVACLGELVGCYPTDALGRRIERDQ